VEAQKGAIVKDEQRKQWTPPQLSVLGDVKELTLHRHKDFGDPKNKRFGTSDGFVFSNAPISG
jgi:hypothetical protein